MTHLTHHHRSLVLISQRFPWISQVSGFPGFREQRTSKNCFKIISKMMRKIGSESGMMNGNAVRSSNLSKDETFLIPVSSADSAQALPQPKCAAARDFTFLAIRVHVHVQTYLPSAPYRENEFFVR